MNIKSVAHHVHFRLQPGKDAQSLVSRELRGIGNGVQFGTESQIKCRPPDSRQAVPQVIVMVAEQHPSAGQLRGGETTGARPNDPHLVTFLSQGLGMTIESPESAPAK